MLSSNAKDHTSLSKQYLPEPIYLYLYVSKSKRLNFTGCNQNELASVHKQRRATNCFSGASVAEIFMMNKVSYIRITTSSIAIRGCR